MEEKGSKGKRDRFRCFRVLPRAVGDGNTSSFRVGCRIPKYSRERGRSTRWIARDELQKMIQDLPLNVLVSSCGSERAGHNTAFLDGWFCPGFAGSRPEAFSPTSSGGEVLLPHSASLECITRNQKPGWPQGMSDKRSSSLHLVYIFVNLFSSPSTTSFTS